MSILNERGLPRTPSSVPHGPYPCLHQSPGGVASRLRVLFAESLFSLSDLTSPYSIQLLIRVVPCVVGEGLIQLWYCSSRTVKLKVYDAILSCDYHVIVFSCDHHVTIM